MTAIVGGAYACFNSKMRAFHSIKASEFNKMSLLVAIKPL
jgi:hypothetical protein